MTSEAIQRDPLRVQFCGAEMGYSRAVRAGDCVYLSGHTAVDSEGRIGQGDIREQTLLTLSKLKTSLERMGCTLDDVVKATVFIADARDFWVMNDVFNQVFPDKRPVRTTVIAQPVLATKVEIDVIAYKPL